MEVEQGHWQSEKHADGQLSAAEIGQVLQELGKVISLMQEAV